MTIGNGGLEDAGREYYDRQFNNRINNIRKPGAAPPKSRSSGYAGRGAIGGGIAALLILGRIFLSCAGAFNSSSSSSNYNTPSYDYTPPPPPPVEFDPPPQPVFVPDRAADDDERLREILRDLERRRMDDPPPVFQPNNPPVDGQNDPPPNPERFPGQGGALPDGDK
ncbi:MAG TPA: hypothetical protein VMS17_17875 [Gemmataceae bacterium]|nr:hypothetical protein [Gemmataceae bacterium]